MKTRAVKGLTLIEVVVGVGVFATLAIVGSLLLITTLRGAKKASAVAKVRSEGANAMGVMTSFLRFADSVSACDTVNESSVTVVTPGGKTVTFACLTAGGGSDMYLASNSARLTSNAVKIASCNGVFVCDAAAPNTGAVTVKFGLTRAGSEAALESTATVNFNSQIGLRNKQ